MNTIISRFAKSVNNKVISLQIILQYQNIYKDYCREFAAKYLNVERFKDYTSSFYYSSKAIDETGENMSFKDYALNKNKAISRG